ncbi:MAG TPA: hypothetical protein VK555_01100 [Terriglobales bacterium]|nr:hypothetical protein [Terriglobales bacterium]
MRSYSFLVEVEAIQPDCEGVPNRVGPVAQLQDCRQTGSYPAGMEEILSDFLEADFWPA